MSCTEYYNWVLKYFSGMVPDDYTVVSCYPTLNFCKELVNDLFDADFDDIDTLVGYSVEFVDSELTKYFQSKIGVKRSIDENVPDNLSYWEKQENLEYGPLIMPLKNWNGIIRISKDGQDIFLCNTIYFDDNSCNTVRLIAFKNREFLGQIIRDYCTARYSHRKRPENKFIRCLNSRENIPMRDISFEDVILPNAIKQDIITSTDAFFKNSAIYDQLGLSRKRGFLFSGSPGNGKTLLCHALANYLYDEYGVSVITITINRNTDNDDVQSLYENAERNSPSLVLLEDIESILTDTQVTRSGFLNILDGLNSANGILTIATTNYPEKLDPALAHRPSRFDRVWTIPMPDKSQRREYLELLISGVTASKTIIDTLTNTTAGWSMAYIQELKATAGVFAVQQDRNHLTEADLLKASELLQAQFKKGTKNHREETVVGAVGFKVA